MNKIKLFVFLILVFSSFPSDARVTCFSPPRITKKQFIDISVNIFCKYKENSIKPDISQNKSYRKYFLSSLKSETGLDIESEGEAFVEGLRALKAFDTKDLSGEIEEKIMSQCSKSYKVEDRKLVNIWTDTTNVVSSPKFKQVPQKVIHDALVESMCEIQKIPNYKNIDQKSEDFQLKKNIIFVNKLIEKGLEVNTCEEVEMEMKRFFVHTSHEFLPKVYKDVEKQCPSGL